MTLHFENALSMTLHEIMTPTFWLAMAGIATAWYFYMVNPVMPIRLRRKLRFMHRILVGQYYLDSLYRNVFVGSALWLGNVFWKWIDVTLIEDWIISRFFIRGTKIVASFISKAGDIDWIVSNILVRGAKRLGYLFWRTGDATLIDGAVTGGSRMMGWFAVVVRYFQSGYLYQYVFIMIIGLLCLLFWFVPIGLR